MDVVLVRPQHPGNVGAVARVMKNFGFSTLVLVNPCELTDETRAQAKHAYDVVRNARTLASFDKAKYDYVVGTTGVVGSERPSLPPGSLKIPKGRCAVLFGNEGTGLAKEELQVCDAIVRIETSSEYPIMNISHAAAIVLYELSRAQTIDASSRKERAALVGTFINILDNLNYKDKERAAEAFERAINRTPPTREEASALLGAFKRVAKEWK